MENFVKRFTDGELTTADSTHFPDSLKYRTLVNKRTVYGGGGIMPDVFVSVDTSYNSPYFSRLFAKNVLTTFTLEYIDRNRNILNSRYKSFDDFKQKFQFSPDDIKSLIDKGEAEGVKFNEEQFNRSRDEILLVLKGQIALNLWQTSEYFQLINQNDNVIEKALKVISDKKGYNTILGNQ
jgi:carboxyl-terminal processing protease